MKRISTLLLAAVLICMAAGCKKNNNTMSNIDEACVKSTLDAFHDKYGDRPDQQAAALWTAEDGTPSEFQEFCLNHFVADSAALQAMADQLERNMESLWGCFNKMTVDLNLPIHVDGPAPTELDELFGAYDPSAHFSAAGCLRADDILPSPVHNVMSFSDKRS